MLLYNMEKCCRSRAIKDKPRLVISEFGERVLVMLLHDIASFPRVGYD